MMAVALVYIVSPIDVLPEALLTIPGLMDDAAVAAWLIASLMGATTAYRAWSGGSAPRLSTDGTVTGRGWGAVGDILRARPGSWWARSSLPDGWWWHQARRTLSIDLPFASSSTSLSR